MILLSAVCLVILSCASGPKGLRDVSEAVDISDVDTSVPVTPENSEDILRKYIADFEIPNPLFGDSYGSNIRMDPSHQNSIRCRVVLLDDYSTDAYVMYQSVADSLEEGQNKVPFDIDSEPGPREGMFRIRISMESGFSEKSMDPDHWVIYIENARGTMIEPDKIVSTPVISNRDSVFSAYQQTHLPRNLLRSRIFLYFKKTTFFGEDLLGPDNPFIVLVMTHEKRTVARIGWITGTIE